MISAVTASMPAASASVSTSHLEPCAGAVHESAEMLLISPSAAVIQSALTAPADEDS